MVMPGKKKDDLPGNGKAPPEEYPRKDDRNSHMEHKQIEE